MGRIQRKKTSVAKKKKKQAAAKQPAVDVKGLDKPGAKKVTLSGGSAKAIKNKQAAAPKRQLAVASPAAAKPKDNVFTKTAQFLREVKVELKKVTWPSRKQTIGSTAVVIALVMLISLFLGVVDFGISGLIRIVLQ